MIMKKYLLLFLLIIAGYSCNNKPAEPEDNFSSKIILTSSSAEYSSYASYRSIVNSDPFVLDSVIFDCDSISIIVSYSGGCKQHTFEIIWSETLSDTEPPQTGIIILHDANEDACEAYITETLTFSVSDLAANLCFDSLYVSVLNGYTPDDSTSSGGWDPADTIDYDDGDYKVVFTESDNCVVKVVAARVICGAGLWDNLWFALEDSLSTGVEGYYFHKYLQPVAIDQSLTGFVPVQGNKYIVGARIQQEHDYQNVPVCLAYSGPSVPVKIMCISELK
jgi:hypothetical protein